MRVRNQKTTINNKVRAIERKLGLDPVKKNKLERNDLVSLINKNITL